MASEKPTSPYSLPSDWRKEYLGERAKLKYLMDNGLFVDVTFKVGSDSQSPAELIQAQSFILKMYSSVFETMFSGNFKESPGALNEPIDIPDVEPSAFKNMLKFLNDSHLDDALDTDGIFCVLYAAKKYDIYELEEECRRLIKVKMSEKDAVSVLQSSQCLNEKDLVAYAQDFIRWNFEAVMESEDFLNIFFTNLCAFLKDDNTVAFEEKIYEGMLRWASTKCSEAGIAITAKNQRYLMKEAFHLIRFPLLPSKVMADVVLPSEILTKEEIVRLFQYELTSKRYGSKNSPLGLPFNSTGRNVHMAENILDRDINTKGIPMSKDGAWRWSNRFIVDQPVTITSFGFKLPCKPTLLDVHFKVFVSTDDKTRTCLAKANHTSVELSWAKTVHLGLQRPFLLEPSVEYTVYFTFKYPEIEASLDESPQDSPKSGKRIVYNQQRSKRVTFTITSIDWMPAIRFHF